MTVQPEDVLTSSAAKRKRDEEFLEEQGAQLAPWQRYALANIEHLRAHRGMNGGIHVDLGCETREEQVIDTGTMNAQMENIAESVRKRSLVAEAYIQLQIAEENLAEAVRIADEHYLGKQPAFSIENKAHKWNITEPPADFKPVVNTNEIHCLSSPHGPYLIELDENGIWVDNTDPTEDELKFYIDKVYEEKPGEDYTPGTFSIKVSKQSADLLIDIDPEKWKLSE